MRQLVFTDVLLLADLMWMVRAFLLLAYTKRTLLSYRRDFIIYRKENVSFQLKLRGASEKFKNQPRLLLRPGTVHFRQHFGNLSRKTASLSAYLDVFYWVHAHLNRIFSECSLCGFTFILRMQGSYFKILLQVTVRCSVFLSLFLTAKK